MKQVRAILAAALALALTGSAAWAQPAATEAARPARPNPACMNPTLDTVHTFYLHSIGQVSDANEVYTALRNMLPADSKSYLIPSRNTIIVCDSNPEQIALAQRIISDLDRPAKNYRLTYTVTEMDGGKRIGTQHFAMVLASGQQTVLKQGSKVPVVTGSYSPAGAGATATGNVQTQVTYLDVGMNFDATLTAFQNGVNLRTSVEQLSLAPETSGVGVQDPIIRQTSLKGSSFLTPGKPLMLGSVDIPGSTRHLDVEVVMEELP